jgi:hypothetical protein
VNGTYPTLARYLAKLPGGLSAHPSCQAKGSVLRMYLDAYPLDASLPDAPEELLSLGNTAAGAWVSEVHNCAASTLIRDVYFTRDDDFYAWLKKASGALFRKPLYRLLMMVASPNLVISGADKRFTQFHRGTKLTIQQDGQSAEVRMEYPPYLYDAFVLRQFSSAFEAAAEAAGALNCSSVWEETGRERAMVRMTWEE